MAASWEQLALGSKCTVAGRSPFITGEPGNSLFSRARWAAARFCAGDFGLLALKWRPTPSFSASSLIILRNLSGSDSVLNCFVPSPAPECGMFRPMERMTAMIFDSPSIFSGSRRASPNPGSKGRTSVPMASFPSYSTSHFEFLSCNPVSAPSCSCARYFSCSARS